FKASHGALPGEYAQLPFPLTAADLEAWRIEDTLAIGRLNQFQLSETMTAEIGHGKFAATYRPRGTHPDGGRMNAWIRAAAPPSEQAHTLSPTGSRAVAAAHTSPPVQGAG